MPKNYLIKNAAIKSLFTGDVTVRDILVEDGIITRLAENIDGPQVRTVLDASGMLITPGWVDCHCHLDEGEGRIGANIEKSILSHGVTYAVDAGSCGADRYELFRENIVKKARLHIKAYLNISRKGVPEESGELLDMSNLDEAACLNMYHRHSDELLGLKVRLDKAICSDPVLALKTIRKMADSIQTPVCIHATRCVLPIEEILAYLKPKDVFAHSYANTPSGILDASGHVKQAVIKARRQGIIFDLSHGRSNFAFSTAQKAIDQGFEVDTISTDLHRFNADGPVYNLANVMSKMLSLGFELDKVLQLVTIAPARALELTDKALSIREGQKADLTGFKIVHGRFRYTDTENTEYISNIAVQSCFTALDTAIFTPGAAPLSL